MVEKVWVYNISFYIISHQKTDSKDINENTQNTSQKSVTQNVAMVKKRGYKIESVSGDDLFNFS